MCCQDGVYRDNQGEVQICTAPDCIRKTMDAAVERLDRRVAELREAS